VLAQGRPAAPPETISRLVGRGGAFRDTPVLNGFWYFFNYFSRIGRAQLVREVTAQLDAFVATGLELSHVDGHLNMHLHPTMLPILIELAPRYGIRAVRLSREPLGPALRHDRRHALRKAGEGVVFHTLAAYGAPRLRAAGIRTVDRVYGMHQTGHIDERYVLSLLRDLPAGVSELYGHPATGQAAAMAHQQPGYDHPGEVAALTSPRVRDVVRAAGIELITHRDL
jgi:hopanoid biosynthesis associated protein HpnK